MKMILSLYFLQYVVAKMLNICDKLYIYDGALDTSKIYSLWEKEAIDKNCGALSIFTGIVRGENNITHLSFDIYLPLLQAWFDLWQEKAKEKQTILYMAHSNGDVEIGKSSYMCGLISKNRKNVLELYNDFIEDFKANAPIWKYDLINGKRIYALERSKEIKGARLI